MGGGESGVVPPDDGLDLTMKQRHGVVVGQIRSCLKPDGHFGENAAQAFQDLLQRGISLTQVGPVLQTSVLQCTRVNMRNELKMTFARKTVKLHSLGITKLDSDELTAAILRAPFLCVAADESLRNGDKKFPIFVSFWDVEVDARWWGTLRICVMKDKTAETQAQLFFDTIVDVLGYSRGRVLYVLSDNTASVSGEVGGCVTLLQRKLRGENTTQRGAKAGAGRGGRGRARGGAVRGRRAVAARGGRGGATGGGRTGAVAGGQTGAVEQA